MQRSPFSALIVSCHLLYILLGGEWNSQTQLALELIQKLVHAGRVSFTIEWGKKVEGNQMPKRAIQVKSREEEQTALVL